MDKLEAETGVSTLAQRVFKRLPMDTSELQSQVRSGARRLEKRVLHALKDRLDQLEPAVRPAASALQALAHNPTIKPDARRLASRMRELLEVSGEHSRDDAQVEFFTWVVDNLVPDQARILSAMSDGSAYPLIHVLAGKKLGIAVEPVLECISSVGRNAGVLWPDTTHVHVHQLRNWGLVEISPEDGTRNTAYELLETETLVRKTIARLESGGLRVQIVRRMLRMSDLGNELWTATRVSEEG